MSDSTDIVRRLAERICGVMEPDGEGDWMAYRDAAEAVLDEFEVVGTYHKSFTYTYGFSPSTQPRRGSVPVYKIADEVTPDA